MSVVKYENNIITFICGVCNREDTEDITGREIQYNEELEEYFPVVVDCSHCEAEGKYVSTYVNINIPEIDEMELEVMELLAPEKECCARREIRKLMWEKRPDLKKKCPIKTTEEYCKKNSRKLENTRKKIRAQKDMAKQQIVNSKPPFSIG